MAYMNQERKAIIAANVKPILKKYGVKATLAVKNHMSIVLNIKSGKVDFNGELMIRDRNREVDTSNGFTVNHYYIEENHTGKSKDFLNEIVEALKSAGWCDRSDIMTDYFDTAYYFDINVGSWKKPYELVK